jgi:hypothetical protein
MENLHEIRMVHIGPKSVTHQQAFNHTLLPIWRGTLADVWLRITSKWSNVNRPIAFIKGNMQKSINTFRQTFCLMLEVSASKFNKKTLEAVWVFIILKKLLASFSMFCSIQFSSFKDKSSSITMFKFLWELKTELRQQQESIAQLTPAASALAIQCQPNPVKKVKKKHRPFCYNGTHNPECTGHTPTECHQLHPAKAIAYHQGLVDKANASLANKKALLSINSGVAYAIVLNSGASSHYLKQNEYFTTLLTIKSLVFGANGVEIPILGTVSAIIHTAFGPIIISEAFYAPDLSNSLISQTHYIRQGYHHLGSLLRSQTLQFPHSPKVYACHAIHSLLHCVTPLYH